MDDHFHHDLRLSRRLWDRLSPGDILLGDRLFGEYPTQASLPLRGVDVLARLSFRRKSIFARPSA